jgi:hypothetical protein
LRDEAGQLLGLLQRDLRAGIEQQLANFVDRQVFNANLFDPTDLQRIDRKRVREIAPGNFSLMPAGLLDRLDPGEIADLLAFLMRLGANPKSALEERSRKVR